MVAGRLPDPPQRRRYPTVCVRCGIDYLAGRPGGMYCPSCRNLVRSGATDAHGTVEGLGTCQGCGNRRNALRLANRGGLCAACAPTVREMARIKPEPAPRGEVLDLATLRRTRCPHCHERKGWIVEDGPYGCEASCFCCGYVAHGSPPLPFVQERPDGRIPHVGKLKLD